MAPHRLDAPQVSDAQNRLIGQIASHYHYIRKVPPNTVSSKKINKYKHQTYSQTHVPLHSDEATDIGG
jgi:hypothetical protein